MAFLEESGYMELITDRMSDSVYISKEAFDINFDQNREVTVFDDGKMVSKEETISLFPSDCIKLEKDDGKQIVKQLLAGKLTSYIDVKPGSNYIVLIADNSFEVHFGSQTLTIPSEEIPEYLQKYVG